MRLQTRFFRLTASVAAASLLMAQLADSRAFAQGAPPVAAMPLAPGPAISAPAVSPPAAPGPAIAAAPAPAGDPPARVGRASARLAGTVSFHTVGQTQWEPAALNYPVTSGDAFWTEPQSSAEIEVGPMLAALDQTTEFDIDTLDDRLMGATLPQGAAFLQPRALQ